MLARMSAGGHRRTTVSIAPGVLHQVVGGEVVLLDLEREYYYGLDDVGSRIWQLLIEHGDPDAVAAEMLLEFDTDEPTLRRDIDELVDRLADVGLVTRT
jgi:hypothetical protein